MRRILCSCALGAALLLATVPAAAQSPRPGRPYRGLFASGTADATHLLTASGSFGIGYDNDLIADARGGNTTSGTSWEGGLGNFSGGLSYSLQEEKFTLSGSLGTSVRYYPSLAQTLVHGSSGSLSLSAPLGTRAGLSVGGSVSYQPHSFSALFPTELPSPVQEADTPDLDTIVDTEPYVSYQANAGVSYSLTSRTSLSGGANYRAAAQSAANASDFYRYGGGVSLSHNIGRGLDFRVGYSHSVAHYSPEYEVTSQSIDAGLDFSRALSISRRTTLSFSTGTSMTATGTSPRRFRIVGGASLQHEIGRSWHTALGYGRRVTIHESWLEPVMSDGVTATLSGLLTRRLQFSASANGALGTVGAETNAPGFDSVSANASLSTALTRFMSIGVTYAYYHHRFDEGAALPFGVRPQMDRQSIRASVSLWAPLVTLTRRSNASR
jgi:hypothetical protein